MSVIGNIVRIRDAYLGAITVLRAARFEGGSACWEWTDIDLKVRPSLVFYGEKSVGGRTVGAAIAADPTSMAACTWSLCAVSEEHARLLQDWLASNDDHELVSDREGAS